LIYSEIKKALRCFVKPSNMDMILNGNYLQQHRVDGIQQQQQQIIPAPSKCEFEVM